MNEKKKVPIALVIVLLILGIPLIIFLTWYRGEKTKEKKENEQTSSYVQEEQSSQNLVSPEIGEESSSNTVNNSINSDIYDDIKLQGEILNFPQRSSETEVLLSTVRTLSTEEIQSLIPTSANNFKDKEIKKFGNIYKVVCKEHSSAEAECQKPVLSINNNYAIELKDYTGIINSELYSYNGVIVLVERSTETERINVSIYRDKALMMTLKLLRSVSDKTRTIKTEPVIKDFKIYFVTEESYDSNNYIFDCSYKYIDFSNSDLNINTIQNFKSISKAYFNQR